VYVLEGGYDLTAVSWGVRRTFEVLLGEEPEPDPLGLAPREGGIDVSGLLEEMREMWGLG
jgi:hypothetical protein